MLVRGLALAAALTAAAPALALVVFALATVVGAGFVCPRPGGASIKGLRCLALVRRWLAGDLRGRGLLAGHGRQCVRPL